MKPLAILVCMLALLPTAQAHHLWIVPDEKFDDQAIVVFSDSLEPDRAELLKRVAHADCWLLDSSEKETSLEWQIRKNYFVIDLPGRGPRRVGGRCVYGVETFDHRLRRDVDPYLLVYYPQTIVQGTEAATPWKRLPLQILSTRAKDGMMLEVRFDGKPVAQAELIVLPPDGESPQSQRVDEKGRLIWRGKEPGLYGFRTRHLEAKTGTHGGKEYREVRHHASLVLRWSDKATVRSFGRGKNQVLPSISLKRGK